MTAAMMIAPAVTISPPATAEPPAEPASQREATPSEPRWIPLFDGRTLEGWQGDPKFWTVEDGCIVGRSTAANPCNVTTYLHHARPCSDFIIEFEIKLEGEGANSGLQYRSKLWPGKDGDGFDLSGYQADIDQRHAYTGILYESYGRGIAVGRGRLAIGVLRGGATQAPPDGADGVKHDPPAFTKTLVAL